MLGQIHNSGKDILAPKLAHVWIPIDNLILAVLQFLPGVIIQYHDIRILSQREFPIIVLLDEGCEEVMGVGASGNVQGDFPCSESFDWLGTD